jgi:tetratricopeptide (TPR) repeat protein
MQPATLPKTSIHLMKLTSIRGLLSLSFVCLQLCSPAMAAADSHLAEAEQAFAAKRFHAAEDLLNTALAKNPTDQEAHLLLARTFVQLIDNKAAEREYANCIKCNPFSAVGRMAHQETINIGGRSAADKARPADDVTTVSKSVDAINREANELKGGYGTASNTMTPNYYNPQSTAASTQASTAANRAASRAARHAELQAARAASRAARMNGANGQQGMQGAYGQPGLPSASMQPGLSAYGQPGATQAFAQARFDSLRAKTEARRAARMSRLNRPPAAPYSPTPISASNTAPGVNTVAPPVIPSAMSMATQPYTPSTILRASRQRGARAVRSIAPSVSPSYNASDAQVQQMRKQQENAQHAQYEQDSANNLERLMSEKQNPNSPKLRALGTNLFVRYYGSHDQDGSTATAPAADPVMEMKAKQMKLGDTKGSVAKISPKI